MSQKIYVDLQFRADTKAAQKSVSQLQQQLNTAIMGTASKPLGATKQLQEAQKHATQLKVAINNAFNVDTGKLNLTKFQNELKRSGLTVQQLGNSLKLLGPSGVQAFSSMTKLVSQANTSLFNLEGGIKKLSNTFFNT